MSRPNLTTITFICILYVIQLNNHQTTSPCSLFGSILSKAEDQHNQVNEYRLQSLNPLFFSLLTFSQDQDDEPWNVSWLASAWKTEGDAERHRPELLLHRIRHLVKMPPGYFPREVLEMFMPGSSVGGAGGAKNERNYDDSEGCSCIKDIGSICSGSQRGQLWGHFICDYLVGSLSNYIF